MSALATRAALPRSRRVTGLAVGLSAIAGALVALAVMSFSGGASHHAPARPFAMAIPAGWHTVPAARLGTHPLAAIRRDDGRAIVTVTATAPVHATGAQLAQDVGRRLHARLHDFRPVSARIATVRGGHAFVYTFAHGRSVQMLALAGVHGRAYAIDAVITAGAAGAARQAGAIVRSFGP